jgi:hypothetical protein
MLWVEGCRLIPDETSGFLYWPNPSNCAMALGVKGSRHVRLISLSSVMWLSIKCGSLNISQPYGPPRIASPLTTVYQGYHPYLSKGQNFIYGVNNTECTSRGFTLQPSRMWLCHNPEDLDLLLPLEHQISCQMQLWTKLVLWLMQDNCPSCNGSQIIFKLQQVYNLQNEMFVD